MIMITQYTQYSESSSLLSSEKKTTIAVHWTERKVLGTDVAFNMTNIHCNDQNFQNCPIDINQCKPSMFHFLCAILHLTIMHVESVCLRQYTRQIVCLSARSSTFPADPDHGVWVLGP